MNIDTEKDIMTLINDDNISDNEKVETLAKFAISALETISILRQQKVQTMRKIPTVDTNPGYGII